MKRLAFILMPLVAMVVVVAACAKATPTPTPRPPTATPRPAAPTAIPPPAATPTSPPAASPTARPAATPTPVPAPTKSPAQLKYEDALKGWDNVVAAAKKEGKVVLAYFSTPAGASLELEDAFSKKYGITVESIAGKSPEIIARLQGEIATSRYTMDVRSSGTGDRVFIAMGLHQPFVPPAALEPGVPWVLDPILDGEGQAILAANNANFLVVNDKLVPRGEEPKSWKAMADPKWKGKFAWDDPRVNGPSSHITFIGDRIYGREWLRALLGNVGKIFNTGTESIRAVALGEFAVTGDTTGGGLQPYLDLPTIPIRWVKPEDGEITFFSPLMFVFKGAPHPNAAKLWINWNLSKEAHEIRAKWTGVAVGRKDVVPAKYPEMATTDKFFGGRPETVKESQEDLQKFFPITKQILAELGK